MNAFMIIVLEFVAGVAGNLIAGWIQQDIWKNVFKRSRIISTIVVAFVTMVITVIATPPPEKSSNTPGISDELQASPYQNSRIDLLSAVPENSSSLLGGDDIAYSYTVKYYVPQFDWARLGLEPQIIVSAEKEETLYGEKGYILLTSIPAQVGTENTVELIGRMIVPNDRQNWGSCRPTADHAELGNNRSFTSTPYEASTDRAQGWRLELTWIGTSL